MDTSKYLIAAYFFFWLLPTLYLFRLTRKTVELEKIIDGAIKSK